MAVKTVLRHRRPRCSPSDSEREMALEVEGYRRCRSWLWDRGVAQSNQQFHTVVCCCLFHFFWVTLPDLTFLTSDWGRSRCLKHLFGRFKDQQMLGRGGFQLVSSPQSAGLCSAIFVDCAVVPLNNCPVICLATAARRELSSLARTASRSSWRLTRHGSSACWYGRRHGH
jgi:hypothetical protein